MITDWGKGAAGHVTSMGIWKEKWTYHTEFTENISLKNYNLPGNQFLTLKAKSEENQKIVTAHREPLSANPDCCLSVWVQTNEMQRVN